MNEQTLIAYPFVKWANTKLLHLKRRFIVTSLICIGSVQIVALYYDAINASINLKHEYEIAINLLNGLITMYDVYL